MGQFSWNTQDTKTPIYNDWDVAGDRQTIHMVDPRDGTDYKEEGYEGYGVFGGRDFYELFADINKDLIYEIYKQDENTDTEIEVPAYLVNEPDEKKKEILLKIWQSKHYNMKELLNKKFEDLTKDDIDNKRQLGIDFWFDFVEPESYRDKPIRTIPEGKTWKSPILVEDYDKWERYNEPGCYPESDPDQGWHVKDNWEDEEEL